MHPSDDQPAAPEPSTTADRSVEEQLAVIRALRESLGPHVFDPDEIDAFKREGRHRLQVIAPDAGLRARPT